MTESSNRAAASIRSLAVMIARLAGSVEGGEAREGTPARRRASPAAHAIERNAPLLAQVARMEYRGRRLRTRHIASSLLGEPTWDILLDLFINAVEGRRVCVTSSALASQAPQATALRHLATLEAEGLIAREKSMADARVTFLLLTEEGFHRVGSYLQERANSMLLPASPHSANTPRPVLYVPQLR